MAGELQTVYSVSLPASGLDTHLLAIMVACGLLGAALTVPLFLNMLASTLPEGVRTQSVDFFVFAGFCLIYVVASRRLFENIAQRLPGQTVLDEILGGQEEKKVA